MTGLVGFSYEELNSNACPRARKKDPSQFTSCLACNASTARLGFNYLMVNKQEREAIMKNTLTDLNNHLFAQMERLNEESLNSEQLAFEAERSKSLTIIARTIVDNARLVLDAQTRINDIPERKELPAILK